MNFAAFFDRVVDAGALMWRAAWHASVLALLVIAIHLMIGARIPPRWRHAMWMLVLVRLALPVVPRSPLSVFNLAPALHPGSAVALNTRRQPALAAQPPEAIRPVTGVPAGVRDSDFLKNMRIAEVRSPLEKHASSAAATPSQIIAPPVGKPVRPAWWAEVLGALWLAGAAFLAARVAWATGRLCGMLRRLDRVDDPAVLELLARTARELHVRRPPALLTGDWLFNPALVGFLRPRVLVPRELLARFDVAELRLVFLHELAHLKRRDIASNWFATIVTILHWPNPVAWFAAWRLRVERELACDEMVLSRVAGDAGRRAYGETILNLLEACARAAAARPSVLPAAGAVGILESKQQMKRRITMIAGFVKPTRGWTVVAAVLVVSLSVVALTDAVKAGSSTEMKSKSPPASQPKENTSTGFSASSVDEWSLKTAEEDLQALRRSREKLAMELGANHPNLKVLDDRIASVEKEIANLQDKKPEVVAKTRGPISVDELVTVSIMNLVGQGVETVKTSRVDADGNIDLPYVGLVKAAGLRSVELEKAVAKTYEEKHFMQNPLIVVSLPGRGESHSLSSRKDAAAGAGAASATADAETEVRTYDLGDLASSLHASGGEVVDLVKLAIGNDGRVAQLGTNLIVSATPAGHREIEKVLKMVHEHPTTQHGGGTKVEDMSIEDIAVIDAQMAKDLQIKQELAVQLEQLKRSGAQETNSRRKMIQDMLDTRTKLIEERTNWFREKYKGCRLWGNNMLDADYRLVR